ncbi:hypothetical protein [Streptomyces sp. Go-475]|uniref:hypothetical protein n=1 Tax=Streptomyces sp. Go-475 TaxID=2072505 RepID=UPI000DEED6F3|nr:hypothetical protein [Streptomyces sp. Go-475]AXE89796.1 hypothetical protein C1703_32705 [Streptomyces sp. Go-475]
MAADQLPAEVREFANYLDGLLARLDPSGGWCAVFWQRDPEGMRACLDGREMPPWDVVEALLRDLAGQYGPGGAGPETERARSLHAAALAAFDSRPGGRDALGDQLDVMLREQRFAAERQAGLARRLASATTREQADALRVDLAWARDDHERATARCAELRARMAYLDRQRPGSSPLPTPRRGDHREADRRPRTDGGGPEAAGWARGGETAGDTRGYGSGPVVPVGPDTGASDEHGSPRGGGPRGAVAHGSAHAVTDSGPASETLVRPSAFAESAPVAPQTLVAPDPPAPQPSASRQRKRRRGSARFAGMGEEDAAPVVVPPTDVPAVTVPAPVAGRTPRGARFAGAAEEAVGERAAPEAGQAGPAGAVGPAEWTEVARAVETLARLRGEGRSGEAHALLVEAAYWAPARLPLLAHELERAGLGADWQTLLWEAASLPAGRLVAAADALVAAGREGDGQQMLRQGVSRPPGEVGEAVLGLVAEGRRREVRALLDAYVRTRTPEEAARSAEPDPRRLVPLLLEAAQGVSDERRWDLLHALRVAGHAV